MTQKLTLAQVSYIAKLAKLPLTKEEEDLLAGQLAEVIELVSRLEQIDTKSSEATNQVTQLQNVFREDVPDETRMLTQDQALSGVPPESRHNGFFVVPPVLDL